MGYVLALLATLAAALVIQENLRSMGLKENKVVLFSMPLILPFTAIFLDYFVK